MRLHVWAPGFSRFGGGIGTFSRDLAIGLRDLGHELRLFGKADMPGEWDGMPVWGAGKYSRGMRSPIFAGAVLAACARHRPDHVISTHLNFGAVARLAKRGTGTSFTLVAHGIDVHDGLSSVRHAALRSAERVIAVSAWTRGRVLGLGGIDPCRVRVLPNTLDERRFTIGHRSEELAKRYAIRPEEKVVLTVARLSSSDRHPGDGRPSTERASGYKGCDRMLRALPAVRAACGPVRYLIVGHGTDRRNLESVVRELGLHESVTFAGFVPDIELAEHYRLADVFAMPSTGEGFGIVFLEAMACGTPVLAGNRDGSVDALDGGRLGRLVDPIDVDSIAEGLIALLRRDGPPLWFDRDALRGAVIDRFGRAAFLASLGALWP